MGRSESSVCEWIATRSSTQKAAAASNFDVVVTPDRIVKSTKYTRQQCFENATLRVTRGDAATAIEWMTRAVELVTQDDSQLAIASIYVRRAELYFMAGAYEKTIEDAARALDLREGIDWRARVLQCKANMALGQSSRARCELQLPGEQSLHPGVSTLVRFFSRTGTHSHRSASVGLLSAYGAMTCRDPWYVIDSATHAILTSWASIDVLVRSYLVRATCRFRLEQLDEAMSDVERVLVLVESCGEAYVLYCESLMCMDQWSNALLMIDNFCEVATGPSADKLFHFRQVVKLGIDMTRSRLETKAFRLWSREK